MLEQYAKIRNQINSGDLIEWKSNSFIGWLIRKKTGQDVNHSSLCIDLPYFANWNTPHKYITEANAFGIELNLLSTQLAKHKGQAYYYQLKPEYDLYRNEIAALALSKINTPYDYGSLFKNLFRKVNLDVNRFFCSEFVDWVYQTAIYQNDKPVKAEVPGLLPVKYKELFYSRIALL